MTVLGEMTSMTILFSFYCPYLQDTLSSHFHPFSPYLTPPLPLTRNSPILSPLDDPMTPRNDFMYIILCFFRDARQLSHL
jgi:hypothetical protein